MAISTTDNMYNSDSREIQMRYDIHFKPNADPLVVTKDNYLISSTGLEESQSDSETLLGTVSSNEITFELFNDSKIFTPTNPDSPYYGYIKKDVRVDVYGRVLIDGVETSWDPLGTYYVKDWSTSSDLIASVTANDVLYDVFDAPMPKYQVTKNVSVKEFFKQFFNMLHIDVELDATLLDNLTYAFINKENKEFLTELVNGTLTMCFGNRRGGVTILNRLSAIPLRATITDDDQIMEVVTKQSITIGNDGTSVTCNAPYEGNVIELVTLADNDTPVGLSNITSLQLVATPLVRLSYASVTGSDNVRVRKVAATPTQCEATLENSGDERINANISIYGSVLSFTSTTEADSGTNLLALDSKYVQTREQASRCKKYLRRIVDNKMPTISVKVRGNFRLQIGDKIRVRSNRYKTDFTGIIIRSEYDYTGGLSGTLTLVDAELFGEV